MTEINKGFANIDTINSLQTYGILLGIKSDCFFYLKDYKQSLAFSNRSLILIRRMGLKSEIMNLYLGQSKAYKEMEDFKMSLAMYEKAARLNDTISSEMYDTRMATLNSFNQLDKKEKELALSNKENEKVSIENKRQATLLIAGTLVGILVVVLLILSLRAYKVKQKDNILLNVQKEEIEHQKNTVEEKQKEIVDSINYALQIQKTLLANHELVNQSIPDSFVVFKPKDIVSGDFYWATKKDSRFYLAVCDSTGHGVPGAFMSLLNISFLNEAVNEKNILDPNKIFDHVRKRLIESISQNGRKDGMDGILICLDESTGAITYSSANNPPIILSDEKLTELPYDKMPVGKGEKADPFSLFNIKTKKGDTLYLFTDGYADQFGGPKGKKFKYKQLDEVILLNGSKNLPEQKEILISAFENWKGNLEQVDDVCIIGIRV